MNSHKKARLTFGGRQLLIERIAVMGLIVAAEAAGISRQSERKWLRALRKAARKLSGTARPGPAIPARASTDLANHVHGDHSSNPAAQESSRVGSPTTATSWRPATSPTACSTAPWRPRGVSRRKSKRARPARRQRRQSRSEPARAGKSATGYALRVSPCAVNRTTKIETESLKNQQMSTLIHKR